LKTTTLLNLLFRLYFSLHLCEFHFKVSLALKYYKSNRAKRNRIIGSLRFGPNIRPYIRIRLYLKVLEPPGTHSAPPRLLRIVFFIWHCINYVPMCTHYINSVSSPDRLSRKPSTRGRRVDQSVTTRCSHACLAWTAYCQRACPMWTARHLLTETRKFVDHAAFTRGSRGMHIDPHSVGKRTHDLMDTVIVKKRWKTICWRVNKYLK
jgi:hypothetical protein